MLIGITLQREQYFRLDEAFFTAFRMAVQFTLAGKTKRWNVWDTDTRPYDLTNACHSEENRAFRFDEETFAVLMETLIHFKSRAVRSFAELRMTGLCFKSMAAFKVLVYAQLYFTPQSGMCCPGGREGIMLYLKI